MARGGGRGKERGNAAVGDLRVRLLGPLVLLHSNKTVSLPASRKVRGLFAYLAVAPRPVGRSQLCELLWDAPTDPRGELRWCLSKIRSFIGQRVVTAEDAISLDLTGCSVDALELEQAARIGVEKLDAARQRELLGLIEGDFLAGLEIDRSLGFGNWLTGQRRRFRAVQAALLEQLAEGSDDEEAFACLDRWLELTPFDPRVHEKLLARLAARGRRREGEEHLARTIAVFEAEGLDPGPIRASWRSAVGPAPAGSTVIEIAGAPLGAPLGAPGMPGIARRASIAVMPFLDASGGPRGRAADALAFDITTRLSKLRAMFVIAQGSTWALNERRVGPEEAGRMLNVDYVLSGTVRQQGKRLSVTVELVETRTAHIVWSEIMNHALDDAFLVLEEIGNRIVASIANEIETVERNRAILRPPNSLDAWESLHRGLWHLYRFTTVENQRAREFFKAAVKMDPTFSRAYAGLSFTYFQDSYLGWADRKKSAEKAFISAGQGMKADERDPAANWAMGRALWLRGGITESIAALRRTVDISPNFAMGQYALAFVQSQSGDPAAAIHSADAARVLSPFDPLLFGMLGTRAVSLARMGQFEEAAEWGVKAALRSNAHPHILAIAACTLALAGRLDEARTYAARIKKARPDLKLDEFIGASHYAPDAAELFRKAARMTGLD